MNKRNLRIIFDNYMQSFDVMNDEVHKEYFKWEAFDHFNEEWSKSYDSFAQKLKAAMEKTDILINSKSVYPATGIIKLATIPEEEARLESIFHELIDADDDGNLAKRQKRIEGFVAKANEMIARYEPRGWRYKQDFRSALCYLNLFKPMDNYIYKYNKVHTFAEYTEFRNDIGFGQTFSLAKYYALCDDLVEAIKDYPGLLDLHYSRPYLRNSQNSSHLQDNLHILAFDIIYCTHTYKLFDGINPKRTAKKNPEKVEESISVDSHLDRVEELKKALEELHNNLKKYENISLLNSTVNHKKYCTGKVVGQSGDYITVSFPSKECKFKLPDAVAGGFISVNTDMDASFKERSRLLKEIDKTERALKKIEESLYIILRD